MKAGDAGAFRSGFVAVTGRPNVGKSTLINTILGEELCIVTPKAHTTRNRITAIHTMPGCQMILVDTPGIHESESLFNQAMVAAARQTIEDSDVILMITEAATRVPDEDAAIARLPVIGPRPVVLAVNKVDSVPRRDVPKIVKLFSELRSFDRVIPISALDGSGVDKLIELLCRLLPTGPPLFPEDDVSDLPVRFFVAEMIREQVMIHTSEEIPYKTAVLVEEFKERGRLTVIKADVHVERDSQKRILIGRQGRMIKNIGTAARLKIQEFLGTQVHLELFVKVSKRWTRDERKLKELGYSIK